MKRTLIAVCGLAPQVITETVYALCQQGRRPDLVVVLTTREGRDACLTELFDGEKGAWYRLLDDLKIPIEAIDFSPHRILAVSGPRGRELSDIRDESDNAAFLKACMHAAWEHSRVADNPVFYSIAGGRKTMGACLAFAAQAYGRPQDRIFHVLVSPEFENSREFYYPPTPPVHITLRDGSNEPYTKSTRYARIQLVPMPFFSFRNQLEDRYLQRAYDPATLLSSLVREECPQMVVDLSQGKLTWKNQQLDLPPVQMALYALLAEIKKDHHCADEPCACCDACWLPQHQLLEKQQTLSRLYRALAPGRQPQEMSNSGIYGLTPDNFNSYRSKLNRAIEKRFGVLDAELLRIGSSGKRPHVRYGLKIRREQLVIVR